MSPEPTRPQESQPFDPRAEIPAPDLPYRPGGPRTYRPHIALVGCGAVAVHHLAACRQARWEVVALCDRIEERARQCQADFCPSAEIFTNYRDLLRLDHIDVIDAALPHEPRGAVITDAVRAGKHILSEEPFTTDLDLGLRLTRLAKQYGVKLAVNQPGRWAPYLSYAHRAVQAGLIGQLRTLSLCLNWSHSVSATASTTALRQAILFDFGLHRFDLCALLFDQQRALKVFASLASPPGQTPPSLLLAQATVVFEHGLASLSFDGQCSFGTEEYLQLTGTLGTLRARGRVATCEQIELHTAQGLSRPRLEGHWYDDGFRGAMGELLCAIEEGREPSNSAENNLRTLEIGFAALRSADTGTAMVPGEVRRI